jgi:very-short-patch-repair endonuclease
MQPQHSKIEDALLEKLHNANLKPLRDQKFCLQETKPDFLFKAENIAVYVDGPVHEGKEERDDRLRELLAKREGLDVVSISYKAFTKEETERVFNEIKQAIER